MTRARSLFALLNGRVGSLLRDNRGVSALEFALLLPLMLTLYLGAVELSQGIAAHRKVTLTARTIADLVSQVTSVNNADMTNSLNAAAAVMAPYPVGNLKVIVSSISVDVTGKATIVWSDSLNGTAHTTGESVTLPSTLNIPGSSLIWSEAQYSYTPTIGYVLTNTLTLKDHIYMRPRLANMVARVTP
jgi:Flp pilus assembly protein TadG